MKTIEKMKFEDYLRMPGVSSTQLRKYLECPYTYLYEKSALNTEKNKSKSMNKGSAFHTFFLENDLFNDAYTVMDKINRNTNIYKDALAIATEQGKQIMFPEELCEIKEMADSLNFFLDMKSKEEEMDIVGILAEAKKEVSFFWNENGLDFKSRLDAYNTEHDIVFDIKTTKEPKPSAFSNSIYNYRYDIQASVYCHAYYAAFGKWPKAYVIIAIKNTAPYIVEIYKLSDERMESAAFELEQTIEEMKISERDNYYRTHTVGVTEI